MCINMYAHVFMKARQMLDCECRSGIQKGSLHKKDKYLFQQELEGKMVSSMFKYIKEFYLPPEL